MSNNNSQILLRDLNETEILGAIRVHFTGEHVEGIAVDKLIDGCLTLDDLYAAIRQEMNRRDAPKSTKPLHDR